MSDYIYANGELYNADELYHYGVPGMKWGKRKARYEGVSTDGSKRRAYEQSRQALIEAKRNKKAASKVYSKTYDNWRNKAIADLSPIKKHRDASNKRFEDTVKAAKAANSAEKKYKAAKKAMKVAKKAANIEAKAVKQKYREQYMKGASVAGKIYAKLTDADKHYADLAYGLNNGKFVKETKPKKKR